MNTPIRPISRDELLAALRDLPPLPSVVLELVESLGHDELSATQYAAKISRDQALAAKILRLANSSFYGRGRQVRSVPEAITILGLRTVRGAVTAAGLAGSFRRHPGFDQTTFWRHALGSALCAQALAGELQRDDADVADALEPACGALDARGVGVERIRQSDRRLRRSGACGQQARVEFGAAGSDSGHAHGLRLADADVVRRRDAVRLCTRAGWCRRRAGAGEAGDERGEEAGHGARLT